MGMSHKKLEILVEILLIEISFLIFSIIHNSSFGDYMLTGYTWFMFKLLQEQRVKSEMVEHDRLRYTKNA